MRKRTDAPILHGVVAWVADISGMALTGVALGVVLALVYLGLLRRADHRN